MLEQKGVIIKVFKVIIKKLYLYINIYISPFFNHFANLRTFFITQKTPVFYVFHEAGFLHFKSQRVFREKKFYIKKAGFWSGRDIQ